MTPHSFVGAVSSFLHELAERRQSPEQRRANEAVNRLNANLDGIIAKGADPLRDAIDNMAENR